LVAVAELLNSSPLAFPVLECLHILGFILLAGSIALVDFRLLFAVLPGETAGELSEDVKPWSLMGLGLVLTSGALLFASDPDHYYLNPSFQVKMVCLLLALGFHHTIHRRALRPGSPPGSGKLAAGVSMALWMMVIGSGIFIGFVNGPE
jgi:hypothetical protein